MFLIFGAGNVPLLEKPGSRLVQAKCMKTICGIVRFWVKMHVNYDAPNVMWEPVDTRPSGRHSSLQICSTNFPSGIDYLLSLKTILITTKSQQTNTCSNTSLNNLKKKFSPFRVKLRMSIKTIQLICIGF